MGCWQISRPRLEAESMRLTCLVALTFDEGAAITAKAEAYPVNLPLTDEDFAEMRPAAVVLAPEFFTPPTDWLACGRHWGLATPKSDPQ